MKTLFELDSGSVIDLSQIQLIGSVVNWDNVDVEYSFQPSSRTFSFCVKIVGAEKPFDFYSDTVHPEEKTRTKGSFFGAPSEKYWVFDNKKLEDAKAKNIAQHKRLVEAWKEMRGQTD